MTVTILIILALILGFYVAWNIGANDVANAVGIAVGSGALTLTAAVILAAIFEFLGAFLLGSNVSETVEAGIVNPELFSENSADYVFGMLAALCATGIWLQISSFFGFPVSTTHTIIGAVAGFGLALGGIEAIFWKEMGSIFLSWILSPVLGGIVSFCVFSFIRMKIFYASNPVRVAKRASIFFVFILFFLNSLIILYGGMQAFSFKLNFLELIAYSLLVAIVASSGSLLFTRKIQSHLPIIPRSYLNILSSLRKANKHLLRVEAISLGELQERVQPLASQVSHLCTEVEQLTKEDIVHAELVSVEKIFIYLQIITACFMAFGHGSNDVANAIGPLAAIINVLRGRAILAESSISTYLLLLGGSAIVLGLATWGWRVIETVGKKITQLTPSRGFAAGFGSCMTVILASKMGLPISTTHVVVGAVLGVGFARGIGAINLGTIRDVVLTWIITIPVGAILSVIFFYIFRAIFAKWM